MKLRLLAMIMTGDTHVMCYSKMTNLKGDPKAVPPQDRRALFTVFGNARNTEFIDFTRTAEELSQDKSYSFSTNV